MQQEKGFKERVKDVIINCARLYQSIFVDYEYIICSEAFIYKKFYIINANEDNYEHLTGVHSLINPTDFFIKSYNQTLQEDDFDFIKYRQDEKSVKGSVRRKTIVLPNIANIFNDNTLVEENLIKNQIRCSFATSDNECTLGFIDAKKSRPMSLIRGNELDSSKAKKINLLLRKHISGDKFDEIIIGDLEILYSYRENLEPFLDENLLSQLDSLKKSNIKQLLEETIEIVAPTEEDATKDIEKL